GNIYGRTMGRRVEGTPLAHAVGDAARKHARAAGGRTLYADLQRARVGTAFWSADDQSTYHRWRGQLADLFWSVDTGDCRRWVDLIRHADDLDLWPGMERPHYHGSPGTADLSASHCGSKVCGDHVLVTRLDCRDLWAWHRHWFGGWAERLVIRRGPGCSRSDRNNGGTDHCGRPTIRLDGERRARLSTVDRHDVPVRISGPDSGRAWMGSHLSLVGPRAFRWRSRARLAAAGWSELCPRSTHRTYRYRCHTGILAACRSAV
ncbi:MAG: hypothetical protein AVDCRST_MAG93-9146, partial [uncultured Chloroflexia bacterium]